MRSNSFFFPSRSAAATRSAACSRIVAPSRSAAACAPGASSGAISKSSLAISLSKGIWGICGIGTSPKMGTSTHALVAFLAFASDESDSTPPPPKPRTSSASSAATSRVSLSPSVCRDIKDKGLNISSAVGTGGRFAPNPSTRFCCAAAMDPMNAEAGACAADSKSDVNDAPAYRAASRSRISCTGPPFGSKARRSASRVPWDSFFGFIGPVGAVTTRATFAVSETDASSFFAPTAVTAE
mmetsp:Transcript_4213/g.15489  ORF Transcript_4213/g.15489 Transcript_4213/m.15489 type:complete len:240 (+) Transcript_4213:116-835(+)